MNAPTTGFPLQGDLCTTVLPAKAGIHPFPTVDSRLRGKDGRGVFLGPDGCEVTRLAGWN